jgi:hypothetical protein
MSKKYSCQVLVGLEICGEDDPEKFIPGRYNKCRKCRNLEVKKYQQRLKEQTVRENMEERIEELKDGKKIQLLVESIIRGKTFNEENLTIPEDLMFIKDKINLVSKNSYDLFTNAEEKIKKMGYEIKSMKEKLDTVEKIEAENKQLKQELQENKIEFSKFKMMLEEKLNIKF